MPGPQETCKAERWEFMESVEAPMWIDLREEMRQAGVEKDDPWFQQTHPVHQASLFQTNQIPIQEAEKAVYEATTSSVLEVQQPLPTVKDPKRTGAESACRMRGITFEPLIPQPTTDERTQRTCTVSPRDAIKGSYIEELSKDVSTSTRNPCDSAKSECNTGSSNMATINSDGPEQCEVLSSQVLQDVHTQLFGNSNGPDQDPRPMTGAGTCPSEPSTSVHTRARRPLRANIGGAKRVQQAQLEASCDEPQLSPCGVKSNLRYGLAAVLEPPSSGLVQSGNDIKCSNISANFQKPDEGLDQKQILTTSTNSVEAARNISHVKHGSAGDADADAGKPQRSKTRSATAQTRAPGKAPGKSAVAAQKAGDRSIPAAKLPCNYKTDQRKLSREPAVSRGASTSDRPNSQAMKRRAATAASAHTSRMPKSHPVTGSTSSSSCKYSKGSQANNALAFEDDMASMLAAHNKKFRATPKYEPRMPLKDVRMWEEVTGHKYDNLGPAQRADANLEITRLKRKQTTS